VSGGAAGLQKYSGAGVGAGGRVSGERGLRTEGGVSGERKFLPLRSQALRSTHVIDRRITVRTSSSSSRALLDAGKTQQNTIIK